MKKTLKFIILTTLCVLLAVLSGCGGKDVGKFTAKAAGVWQRNGNLQDERIVVLDDGTWTSQTLENETWTTITQGTVDYNKEYKTFEFSDDNKIYPVEYSSGDGEILHYKNDNYYREENSIDGFATFDGSWYQNGDRESEYYVLENGEWKWFEPQGTAAVSVDSGNLAWDEAAGQLLAYAYADGEVFAAFTPSKDGTLIKDSVPYVFMEDLTADKTQGDGNDASANGGMDPAESKFPIMMRVFYYLDGERDQPSFYFYDDGQVDYDDGYGGTPVSAVYSIDDDEITIKTPGGAMIGILGIIDRSTLLDDGGEDIYALTAD